MCTARSDLADALAELELTDLEATVIDLEAAAGWSIPGAARPLFGHERRAMVRFGALYQIVDDAANLVALHASRVHDAATAALVADLRDHAATPAALLARLNDLTSPTSNARLPLDGVLADVRRDIEASLADVRHTAAGELLDEARRQGVPDHRLPDTHTLKIAAEERRALVEAARRVAEAPLLRVLDVAGREARARVTPTTDPHAVIAAVQTSIDAISDAGVRDEARRAATRSVNAGRAAAAEETPEPEEVYASELLDGNTCAPCAAVDGRMYETLDAALVDYPSGGTFADCLGGDRCRGTLVLVWPTEAAPSLDQSPGSRAHPIDRTPRGPARLPGDKLPDGRDRSA